MKIDEYLAELKGKRVAVVGIGVSNTPLVTMLCSAGIDVTACDKNERESFGETAELLENMGAKLRLGPGYLQGLDHDIIFRSPGIRPDIPEFLAAAERGSEITSEMEAFFRVCPCPIIAVTGSDGKTTTTSIISELLTAAGKTVWLGGNIGRPLLSDTPLMKQDHVAVLELSSFQLMTMEQSPRVAVVTNLAPNHLDVHKDMEEYVLAKKNIFKYQDENGVLVLNLDNEITAGFVTEAKGEVRLFSRRTAVNNGAFLDNGVITAVWDGEISSVMEKGNILIPGEHNVENYMAAFAAVRNLVDRDTMERVAKTFKGVEHRIEFVREKDGVSFYNDSIASSPSRTIAGLNAFDQKVILIAGGYDKHIPFDVLGPEICKHVKALVLTGDTADKIRSAVENCEEYKEQAPEMRQCEDFRDAVCTAAEIARKGDVVLLSPACASFDKFKNFMVRGDTYKDIVNAL